MQRSNYVAFSFPAWLACAGFLLFQSAPYLCAQTVTGTILGTVQDQQGAVVPNVPVSARNLETGAVRSGTTDDLGRYRISSIPAGSYALDASAPGFKTEIRSSVTVTVGADVRVDFSLTVGAVGEKVVVSEEAPQVDTSNSAMGGLVNETVVRELPLNGRDWLQLATLQPGTNIVASQSQDDTARSSRGNGLAISISGGRPTDNAFRIDGLIVNDYSNSSPGSALHVNLGVDAIREFSVLSNTYSAEYGRGSGGVINAITKSGTNEFHGSAFYFIRNSALDARNFFDTQIPPFRRNQFGGSGGGPIKKDKTFFFANYEGLREFKSLSFNSRTLSPNARDGRLADGTTVTVDPRVKPYLALYPLPNGAITGDTGFYVFGGGRTGHENYGIGKLDHAFTDRTTLSASYAFDDAQVAVPDAFNEKLTAAQTRRQNVILNLQHIFSATMLDSLRAGVTRTRAAGGNDIQPSIPLLADKSMGFVPGAPVGNFSVPGLSSFGGIGDSGVDLIGYTAPQVYDDLAWTKGRHSLRFGFGLERIEDNINPANLPNGQWLFGSIKDMLTVNPSQFTADFPGTDAIRGMRATVVGLYAQDDFRLRRNLTVNIGVRYEMGTVVNEVNGKVANLHSLSSAQPVLGNPYYRNPTLKNFAPRVGLAWDLFGDGKTAIRSGFGIFDIVPLPYLFFNRMPRAAPFFLQGLVNNPSPSAFPNQGSTLLGPTSVRDVYIQYDPSRAYKLQWNFNIQHQFGKDISVTAGYVGAAGVHLPIATEDINMVPINLTTRAADGQYFFPTTGPIQRINPNYSKISAITWNGHSSYHALQTNLVKRFSRGFTFQSTHTWSKDIDNASNTLSSSETNNAADSSYAFDPRINRGVSDFDVPHSFVTNLLWEIPGPSAGPAVARFALSGWEMGGIFTAQSGSPFTVRLSNDQARDGNSAVGSKGGWTEAKLRKRSRLLSQRHPSGPALKLPEDRMFRISCVGNAREPRPQYLARTGVAGFRLLSPEDSEDRRKNETAIPCRDVQSAEPCQFPGAISGSLQ
jgi:Carboxypeptidase regulatory-like domain/TonB-dependent Receptor Plug Domain